MKKFCIKTAGIVFEISCLYDYTFEMCAGYLTDENPDVKIEITKDDIDFENQTVVKEAISASNAPPEFSEGVLESTAVYRKIADYLSYNNSVVFHGALISLNSEGYLFTADSGTGKTTHMNNWLKSYPGCIVVNGDKPILKITDNRVIGFGSPWAGKEGFQNNMSVPLKAIVQLNRSEENFIRELDFKDIFSTLISQSYRPKDDHGIFRVINTAKAMENKLKFYYLGCNMDEISAKIAYEGMK